MMVFSILMPVVMFDILNVEEVKGFGPSAWLNFDSDRQLELQSEILGNLMRNSGIDSRLGL